MTEIQIEPITATKVEDSRRLDMLPKYFGRHMTVLENAVYHYMNFLDQSYNGGYWEYYELSNGGFYMAPAGDKVVDIFVDTNGYSGRMGEDAAGLTACLFAMSALCFKTRDESISDLYHKLTAFAVGHKEASAIFCAID